MRASRASFEGLHATRGGAGLAGKLAFATDEMLIRLPDRLNAPNDQATLRRRGLEVTPLLEKLLRRRLALSVARGAEAPEALSLRVKTKSAPTLSALLRVLVGG